MLQSLSPRPSTAETSSAPAARYSLSLARDPLEVEEAQALRYRVFAREMGAQLDPRGTTLGLDIDHFDAFCEHLLVREQESREVVGTYRILDPVGARRAGGYYSETEFDLTALLPIREQLVEVGRSCVHPDHRAGAVVTLLWAGLVQFMHERRHRYLAGCASVSLADGGLTAGSALKSLCDNQLAPEAWRVTPRRGLPFPLPACSTTVNLPPLIKGYQRVGAQLCGEPAWDKDFNTADLFLLLPMERMNPRYAQHFRSRPAAH
jgi:putative hemolysin